MFSKLHEEKKFTFEPFFKHYPLLTFEKDERISRPEELATNVMYLKSGFLKICESASNGKEVIINIVNASKRSNLAFGQCLYMNLYSIEALTQVKGWRAPREAFLSYIKEHDGTYEELVYLFGLNLRSFSEQLGWLKNGDSYTKIAAALYYLGNETVAKRQTERKIGFRLTHQMLANFTGLTRETVTLKLNKLRENGLIDFVGDTLVIKNMNSLRLPA